MSRIKRDKPGAAAGKAIRIPASKRRGEVFTSPSTDGRDREYVVVLERKAIYRKPSFL